MGVGAVEVEVCWCRRAWIRVAPSVVDTFWSSEIVTTESIAKKTF